MNKASVERDHFQILSYKDLQNIHQSTLEVLEKTGVTVMHRTGLDMLADAGAKVDHKLQNVRIPARLVEKSLATVPRSFILAGRAYQKDIHIGLPGKVYSRNGGGPGHIEDLDTGRVRSATLADTRDYARLVDSLETMDIAAPIYAQDTPPATRDIRVLAAMFSGASKHVNMRLLNLTSLPYVVRMAEIVAGSKANLKERPVLTMLESPIAPLKIPEVLVETLFTCGEYGIPLEICSMPIAGATAPITLAGSLLVANVEMIASIVLSQLVHPGAPLLFTPRIMVMDMASGHALTGSIENTLLAVAGIQMAREFYHIPVNMHGPYTDSPVSDAQAGIENSYFTFLPALAGANILTGAGHLEGGLFVSFPQLLIDSEITGMVKRTMDGFEVNEDTLGVEAISRGVTQKSFLTDPHTIAHLRNNGAYKPKLLARIPRQTWLDQGAKTMQQRAGEMARKILASHQPVPLDPPTAKALDEVIADAAKELEHG